MRSSGSWRRCAATRPTSIGCSRRCMFTDIVDSTATAAELGDKGWRDLVERHHGLVRAMLGRYRGTEVDTAGDGFFATFDGPARAVRCAEAIYRGRVRPRHRGSGGRPHGRGRVDRREGRRDRREHRRADRVASPDPRRCSSRTRWRDSSRAPGLAFEDAGEHELKGVPERWRLYRVVEA